MNRIRFSALSLVLVLLLGGCAPKAYSQQTFAMDTIMTFSAYGNKAEETLTESCAYVVQLEKRLSVTDENSEIYAINHANGDWVQVSEETYAILCEALSMCASTDGTLDITAYPAVREWGFTTGEYRIPTQDELSALTEVIDYTAVELDEENHRVRIPAGTQLDLGAVAKGWTGQKLHDQLAAAGVTSATLSLGGNVQTVGAKPDGSPWRVGIQDPDSDQGAYLASVSVIDKAVVTSGGYQRFFEENGETYWHIIDPATAAPARSDVRSATIVGSDGTLCDAFSTALFIMGSDKAARFWRGNQDLSFDYVLVLEDGSIHITKGLEDSFVLVDGYQDRKVTVIMP